eukprot:scaffold16889_cov310-Skeletonema_dohrnii-CCMP3373.AAC.1
MDEHAVRIRAGLLNVIAWLAIMNVFYMRNLLLVDVIFGIVSWEFVTSMLFGLTPFAPLGTIATLMAVVFQPSPLWKPAAPKRFAWGVGLTLAISCFVIIQFKDEISEKYFNAALAAIALTCNLFTWLESAAGFCVGCFVYDNVFVKYLGKEECKE